MRNAIDTLPRASRSLDIADVQYALGTMFPPLFNRNGSDRQHPNQRERHKDGYDELGSGDPPRRLAPGHIPARRKEMMGERARSFH